MSNLRNLFTSKDYKVFMKRLCTLTIVVAVLGLIMFFTHIDGARLVLLLACGSAAVLLLTFVLQMIVMRKDN